jgi:hypothetical protein|tara:strand:+ start:5336 stop:5581 length:246 start_codon:yes stop_codon:yes gene_type:complete
MYRSFIRKHPTSIAILLFIGMFYAIQCCSPAFLYKKDGSLRQFGLGYKEKTILPIWLIALVLSILSYLFVMYYLAMPRFNY